MSGHAAERSVCLCIVVAALVLLPAAPAQGILVETDRELYEPGEAIRITGDIEAVPTGGAVTIRILNELGGGDILQVTPNKAGTFEAVVEKRLADGWYTIQATHNDVVSVPIAFRVGQLVVPVEPEVVEPEVPEVVEQPETAVPVKPPEPKKMAGSIIDQISRFVDDVGLRENWPLLLALVGGVAAILVIRKLFRSKLARSQQVGGWTHAEHARQTQQAKPPTSSPGGRSDLKTLLDRTVVVDTNICINYMFHRISMGEGRQASYVRHMRSGKMDGRIPGNIDVALAEGRLCIPETTIREFQSKLHEDVKPEDKTAVGVPVDSKITMYLLVERGFKRLCAMNGFIRLLADSPNVPSIAGYGASELERVREFRKKIEGDHNFGKMKSGRVKAPEDVLDQGDMEVLATAMSVSGKNGLPPCLLTMDSDFTRYAGMILDLGVEIVSGYEE